MDGAFIQENGDALFAYEQLPEDFHQDALSWGYAADEFTDYGYFPPQLYVREARRLQGEYSFTENDVRLAPGLERSPVLVRQHCGRGLSD